jgi:hypothetical protein
MVLPDSSNSASAYPSRVSRKRKRWEREVDEKSGERMGCVRVAVHCHAVADLGQGLLWHVARKVRRRAYRDAPRPRRLGWLVYEEGRGLLVVERWMVV